MLSCRVYKLALSTIFLTVAVAPAAHADNGYQPYYYTRDELQFARPVQPQQAAPIGRADLQFAAPAPVTQQVPAYDRQSTQFAASASVTQRPMAVPVNDLADSGPVMDMSGGLGW